MHTKTGLRASCALLIGAFVLLSTSVAISQADDTQGAREDKPEAGVDGLSTPSGPIYSYPVRPGSPEWKALRSHAEMVEVCQVPEDILENMSTAALVSTCLSYPLLGEIFAFNSTQDGIDTVTSRSNCLRALLERPDAAEELLQLYKRMSPSGFDKKLSLLEKGEYAMDLAYVEILLAQDSLLASLERNDRIVLLREYMKKLRSKNQYPEVYGHFSQTTVVFGMARTLSRIDPPNFRRKLNQDSKLERFIEECGPLDKETAAEVVRNAEEFIESAFPLE